MVAFRIGDASPLQTVDKEMSERSGYARILLSRLPHGLSRWLRGDLPGKLRRRHGLPVEHVIAALILMGPAKATNTCRRENPTSAGPVADYNCFP